MKRPGLACLARGGQPQIQRESERISGRVSMRPESRYLDDALFQRFAPNFDAIVATRPVGGDELSDYLRGDDAMGGVAPKRFEAGGYADRGYEGGYGSFADAMGNTSWGGWDYSGPTGGGYVGSTEGATQGYGSNGYEWGGGNTYSGTFDTSGASDSGMGGGVGGSEPQGGGDWNGGGSYGEGAGGEYGGGYSDPYGGVDPNAGADPFGGFGSGIGGGMGWDPFSSTPIAQQNIDLTAPQTNYSRDVPAEYASPNQTIPGEAPTTSTAGTLGQIASSIPSAFNYMDRLEREQPKDSVDEALGDRQYGGWGLQGPQGANWGPGGAPTSAYVGNPNGTMPGAYGGSVRDNDPLGYNQTGTFGLSGAQSTGYGGQVGGAGLIGAIEGGMMAAPSMTAFGTTPYGGGPLGPMSQRDAFLSGFMPGAINASRQTGIDSRIIAGQGALESNWGKSPSGKNNELGMKGPGTTVATKEFVNGKEISTKDSFRDFSSPAKQFEFYSSLMNRPAFAEVGRQKTYQGQIDALDDSPYATDPRYGAKVDILASGINPGLYDLATRDIGSGYGMMGRAMRENEVPAYGGPTGSVSSLSDEQSSPVSSYASMSLPMGFSFPSISDMLGISSAQAAMRSSTPGEQEDPGTGYNTAYGATPSFMQETYAPDTIGRGVGGSPFGYAGTPNFDSAMRGMNPQYGIMTNDIPSNDLPAGLPSFVGADMARAFDPAAFSGPALGGTFGPQPSGQMVDERPVESYGFAGQAVGANERQATSGTSKPETFAGTGGSAARGSQLADDLTAPTEVSSPKVASVDPDKPEEEDAPSSPSGRSSTSTRAVDPLTGKSYNPQTGYTYLAEPNTIARVLDAAVSPVPVLGPLNMLGSLFGYSVGNGMAKGVPSAPFDPVAYGNAGSDSRDAQYLGPSQVASASPPPQAAASPSEALGIPVNADWARRNYLGVNDPRRYGLNPQQTMFAARGGLASLRGK